MCPGWTWSRSRLGKWLPALAVVCQDADGDLVATRALSVISLYSDLVVAGVGVLLDIETGPWLFDCARALCRTHGGP